MVDTVPTITGGKKVLGGMCEALVVQRSGAQRMTSRPCDQRSTALKKLLRNRAHGQRKHIAYNSKLKLSGGSRSLPIATKSRSESRNCNLRNHCQATEEFSGSEDDWEVEEVDDGMVAYAWKSKDELLQQWDEQRSKELPLPPIPEPACADEASLRLAQFRPSRRTPQELKRLLEARANPDIVVTTEIWGGICPLAKVIGFAKAAHVPRILQPGLSMDLPGLLVHPRYSLPRAPIRICSVDEMREISCLAFLFFFSSCLFFSFFLSARVPLLCQPFFIINEKV